MAQPTFRNRAEFDEAAAAAGVDASTCAWVATTKLVDFMGFGINIATETDVRAAYAEEGYEPGAVEVKPADPGEFNCAARIGCSLCEQVVVIYGPEDAQGFGTGRDRTCLIWEYVPES